MSETAGSLLLVGLILGMWALVIMYLHTNKRLAEILWPWNNHSVRYAILGRKNWHDILKSDYVSIDGYFDMERYIDNIGAPDFLKLCGDEGTIRLCTPRKGVFFDLYFDITNGEKMLIRIEKVKIRNLFEYWLMPSKAIYSLRKEAETAKPFYEYTVPEWKQMKMPDFMLTRVALLAFCDEMSALSEN